ncbi:phage tail tape measure protein [Shuttleworthella satelles]|uniref:Phage tail tape measure protein, TP901 family n=1 Tax=Shuttleworthella satelles DSM 14600 TaxID=626523 RepID=C4GAR6_9FIRM|nr:phage tail tape measure protein [Shuttleworthia satelles]EEP28209.1 phage tail tape measure protein, TP901 family [Shuttleworthia satelles DSM 14600]
MSGTIKGITIQLGGDTTRLSDALSKAQKSIKGTQRSLSDVNKALKLNPGNVDLLKEKQKLLADRIQATKTKLDALKQAQEKLDAKGVDKNSQEYRKLEREIAITKTSLTALTKEAKRFGSSGAQSLKALSARMKSFGAKITSVGKSISTHVTAPIVGIGVAAGAAWKEVEEGADSVKTKTGATGEALEDMENRMRSIASSVPTDFKTAGDAIGEVNTRFGLTGQALEDLSAKYVKFAKINGEDVTQAVDSSQAAMAAFNIPAEQAGDFLDMLTKQSQDTGISVTSLSQSMTQLGPSLQEIGLSASDSATLLASLDKNGIDASTAMTGMKAVLKNAAKEGKPATKMLEELDAKMKSGASSTDKMKAATEIFGAKAGPQLAKAMMEGKLSLDAMGKSLQDYAGATEGTFDRTVKPVDRMKIAMNSLKSTGAQLFETVQTMATPIIEKLVAGMQKLNEWFQKLSPGQQEMIVKIGLIVAAIGPLVFIIGKVISLVGAVAGALPAIGAAIGVLTGPIGWIVLAISGAVAAGVLLYKNWDKIKAKAKELGENIQKKWGEIKQKTHEAWEGIKNGVQEKWNALKDHVANSPIGQVVGAAWEAAKATMTQHLSAMRQAYDEHGGGLQGAVAATMEGVKGHFMTGYDFLNNITGGKLGEMVGNARGRFDEMAASAREKMGSIRDSIGEKLSGGVQNGLARLGEFAAGAGDKMGKAKEFFRSGLDAIKGFWAGLHLEFPKIKLPHFTVSGGLDLSKFPPELPHIGIDWYDRGGIFSGPQIIGVGEKRPEFVGALDDLRKIVREESGGGEVLLQIAGLLSKLLAQNAERGRILESMLSSGPTYQVVVDGITLNDTAQMDSRITDFVAEMLRKGRMY